jgi:hypothetical protein
MFLTGYPATLARVRAYMAGDLTVLLDLAPEEEPCNTKVILGVRMEPELIERCREEARRNRRLLGQEIASLVEEALAQRQRERRKEARARTKRAAVPFSVRQTSRGCCWRGSGEPAVHLGRIRRRSCWSSRQPPCDHCYPVIEARRAASVDRQLFRAHYVLIFQR